ncbi:MAG: glucosidase, partial [Candidatus Omnitrophica bacterium]|nr:glucosidase [Candidatus Omnitrophota bacterium]
MSKTAEEQRLQDDRLQKTIWYHWGPYLAARQWGNVREDYSADGDAWDYFTFDQARMRAFRWGEDGIAGICDYHQWLCLAPVFWNGADPFLKERLYGLSGKEGNHGEDVKEYYFYLDNTPTHAYMKHLYKYPQKAFPYQKLRDENSKRTRQMPEYELLDTGIFDDNSYFEIVTEYAKNAPEDILMRISVTNRGPKEAVLHLLPTLWFRNVWSWANAPRPSLKVSAKDKNVIEAAHQQLGRYFLYCQQGAELLFCDNDTDTQKIFGVPNAGPYVKDGINEYVVAGRKEAVNPAQTGTKMAASYVLNIPAGATQTIRLRLANADDIKDALGRGFEAVFDLRQKEADEFYSQGCPFQLAGPLRQIQRSAFASLLWNKQFYHYVVEEWLDGDPAQPVPPSNRKSGRNSGWEHLYSEDVIAMPDKWEYPWFAAWDLAFHTIPLSMIDPEFAKRQLLKLTREWYMHPNGQIPAYEWNFSDVNPPVQAWAALRVYRITKRMHGIDDKLFLERVFQKLLMNFTWWINREDAEGNNVFQGGFLGFDNIGVFNRSQLPTGGHMDQADGTAWMAMYCLNMLAIALELAPQDPSYEDIASKFYVHFLHIADAMNRIGPNQINMWDQADGFYYDVLRLPDGRHSSLKVRSMVGILPLFAVETIDPKVWEVLPEFKKRVEWFMKYRTDLTGNVTCMETAGQQGLRLLSIVDRDKLKRILQRVLDEKEFLSPCGVRSLSKTYDGQPYVFSLDGHSFSVDYEPAEATVGLFGGNSNWRGPVWFPVNYLLIESLQKFHYYFGNDFQVEFPVGSGKFLNLWEIASELSRRLVNIFVPDTQGRRPVYAGNPKFQNDPYWKDLLLFFEYFNGDTGQGLGASHQAGWTALVAKLIQ